MRFLIGDDIMSIQIHIEDTKTNGSTSFFISTVGRVCLILVDTLAKVLSIYPVVIRLDGSYFS